MSVTMTNAAIKVSGLLVGDYVSMCTSSGEPLEIHKKDSNCKIEVKLNGNTLTPREDYRIHPDGILEIIFTASGNYCLSTDLHLYEGNAEATLCLDNAIDKVNLIGNLMALSMWQTLPAASRQEASLKFVENFSKICGPGATVNIKKLKHMMQEESPFKFELFIGGGDDT
jgi:hypothetical protein